MYDLTSLLVICLVVCIAGLAGGYLIGRFTGTGRQAGDFKKQLDDTQSELDNYREQVYQQFGETARKFERLQDSYADLHTQLASSAEVLCAGKMAGPLLAAPVLAAALESDDNIASEPSVDGPEMEVEATEVVSETTETEIPTVYPEVVPESEIEELTEDDQPTSAEVTEITPAAVDELLESQANDNPIPAEGESDFGKQDAA